MLTDPAEDYARGFVPFLNSTIFLDSRPLIPRPETEFWVEKAIEEVRKHAAPRVLDLFSGSGAVGVAVLKHVPGSHVDFGEINPAHLATIRKNILENGIDESRTAIFETDVFEKISGIYDFILANPPYIAEGAADVDDTVLAHEPHEALFAGDDGFALIERTVAGARRCLAPDGVLYIEHRPEQAVRIAETAVKNGLEARSYPDQYGVVRYSVLRVQPSQGVA